MIYNHPIGKDYKWYILPIGGLYGTFHLLREPGNSIDFRSPGQQVIRIIRVIRLLRFDLEGKSRVRSTTPRYVSCYIPEIERLNTNQKMMAPYLKTEIPTPNPSLFRQVFSEFHSSNFGEVNM